MNEDFSSSVYSKNIIEFLTVASEYCGFLEKSEKFSKREFLEKSQKILALLYLKSSLIDKIEIIEDGDIERFVTESDYLFIQESLSAKFGTLEQFIDVWEPRASEKSEVVQVSLSECFADIYQDLKDFALNYQIGNEQIMIEIISQSKLNFEVFWGPRILALLNTIHNIIYSDENLEDENEENNHKHKKKNSKTKNGLLNNKFESYQDDLDNDAFDDIFGNDVE